MVLSRRPRTISQRQLQTGNRVHVLRAGTQTAACALSRRGAAGPQQPRGPPVESRGRPSGCDEVRQALGRNRSDSCHDASRPSPGSSAEWRESKGRPRPRPCLALWAPSWLPEHDGFVHSSDATSLSASGSGSARRGPPPSRTPLCPQRGLVCHGHAHVILPTDTRAPRW